MSEFHGIQLYVVVNQRKIQNDYPLYLDVVWIRALGLVESWAVKTVRFVIIPKIGRAHV